MAIALLWIHALCLIYLIQCMCGVRNQTRAAFEYVNVSETERDEYESN